MSAPATAGKGALPSRAAQVLALLLEAGAPRSGEEMGRVLGCSRAAVGKAVTALREQGFAIQARPRAGYLLEAEPTGLVPARVEARLNAGGLGLPLIHLDEIDSTNLEARRRAEAGAPHGACLVAEHQSAGRGRLDRRWQAPPGSSLLMSLILRPRLDISRVFALTSLAAAAVCRAIEAMSELRPMIKWPNDVYLEGQKLAGVLTEFTCRAEALEFAVVGVGLNVNLTPAQIAKLPAPAASLRAASGHVWDRAELLAMVLAKADQLYALVKAGDWPALAAEYQARSWLAGKRVTVRDGNEEITGLARGMDEDGALVLEQGPDRIRRVRHGDVSVLSVEKAP